MKGFRMMLADQFHFSDGRVILVGRVGAYPKLIRKCVCPLYLDGVKVMDVNIIGEEMIHRTLKSRPRSEACAISTYDPIRLDETYLKEGRYELILDSCDE